MSMPILVVARNRKRFESYCSHRGLLPSQAVFVTGVPMLRSVRRGRLEIVATDGYLRHGAWREILDYVMYRHGIIDYVDAKDSNPNWNSWGPNTIGPPSVEKIEWSEQG